MRHRHFDPGQCPRRIHSIRFGVAKDPAVTENLYRAEPLSVADAMKAFPLVHLLYPEVSPASWRTYVRHANRLPLSRGGLVSVMDWRGYCHAIFSYHVRQALPVGRALQVSDVVMGQLPGSELSQAIVVWTERLAGELGTDAVAIDLHTGMLTTADADTLLQSGFRESGLMLTRRFVPIP
jgi:hypothetical protein